MTVVARLAAVARHDLRLFARDPLPAVVSTVLPLLLMWYLEPTMDAALSTPGATGSSRGAGQVVSGMATMFAFFSLANVGYWFFREHIWNTWDRLRASTLSPHEVFFGKLIVPVTIVFIQQSFLFSAGAFMLDLDIAGPIPALAIMVWATVCAFLALILVLYSYLRTMMQFESIANVTALVLAGFGGAIVPHDLLPDLAQDIAPAAPSYWAMEGYKDVIIDGEGVRGITDNVAVLIAFAVVYAAIAAVGVRLRGSRKGV